MRLFIRKEQRQLTVAGGLRIALLALLLSPASVHATPASTGRAARTRADRAEQAYQIARNADYIPWRFRDFCEARALALNAELAVANIPSSVVFLQKPAPERPLTPPSLGNVVWKNHVAVLVDGKIIDPALCSGPTTLKTWTRLAGQPEGTKPRMRIMPGSYSFGRASLDYGGKRITCNATKTMAGLPSFDGEQMIDAYDNLVWSWAMAGGEHSREIRKACDRMSQVMNQLLGQGRLSPTAYRGVIVYPPWWPARLELDRVAGRYVSLPR